MPLEAGDQKERSRENQQVIGQKGNDDRSPCLPGNSVEFLRHLGHRSGPLLTDSGDLESRRS